MENTVIESNPTPLEKRVSDMKSEFFWATDDVISSIHAVITKPNHCAVVVWAEESSEATVLDVDVAWKCDAQWQQYRQHGLSLIQKTNGDLFAAATASERIALIATETAEGLISPDHDDRTKTILARFITYAMSEAEDTPFNAVFFEIKEADIPLRVVNFTA